MPHSITLFGPWAWQELSSRSSWSQESHAEAHQQAKITNKFDQEISRSTTSLYGSSKPCSSVVKLEMSMNEFSAD